MRLVTYMSNDGPRAGAVENENGVAYVVDIGRASSDRLPSDLLALIDQGFDVAAIAASLEQADELLPLEQTQLLAPLARPRKLLATASNYQDHILESGLAAIDKTATIPKLFIKPASTIIGPREPIRLPTLSDQVDWELELAVVIGYRAKDVPEGEALSYVAGYTVINDVSARRLNWGVDREVAHFDAFFDWLNGKWLDGFAPMGPCITTTDEIADPQNLRLRLRVNGQEKQDGSTADMIFGVAELVAFASRLMTLEPGDVLATGTPAGVGATTGEYLKPNDLMEGEIEQIGSLITPVLGPED